MNIPKRSSTAAAANTDTIIFIPILGQTVTLLSLLIAIEGAAQAAGMTFELRFGANVIAIVGLDSSTAPIGQTSKPLILNHPIVGDGSTPIQVRNLVALAASSNAAYTLTTNP
jgi:hypothetical protein